MKGEGYSVTQAVTGILVAGLVCIGVHYIPCTLSLRIYTVTVQYYNPGETQLLYTYRE